MTPALKLPRLDLVFFNTARTVSDTTGGINLRSTAVWASKRTVHRQCPVGGVLQAKAMRRASSSMVNLWGAPVRGSSAKALTTPFALRRNRVRRTVARLVSNASAICSSVQPLALLSKIRARNTVREERLPVRMMRNSLWRWAVLRMTFFFSGIGLSLLCKTF